MHRPRCRRRGGARVGQAVGVAHRDVLRAAIRVDDQATVQLTVVQGLLERIKHQIGAHAGARPPADDAPREHVQHERDLHEAAPRRDVREVSHPELTGPVRRELALH